MVRSRLRRRVVAVAAGLAACVVVAASPARAEDVPPRQLLTAVNALPPGQSGHVTVAGQAAGMASGDPDDYGPHVDDQREMFWEGRHKPGSFATVSGTPASPRPGVRIYRDEYGVPVIYGDTGADVWFGAGYAAGQDRLFLADAVRRLGRGRFAELGGPSYVPADVRVRIGAYTDEEYAEMLDALPAEGREAVEAYSAGLDAWIAEVRLDPANKLPAEYAVLSSLPEPWEVVDTLAAGVYITRYVASAGLLEPEPLTVLRELDSALGREAALDAFADLFPRSDPRTVTTVPRSSGTFDASAVPAGRRDAVYRERAAYALSLPAELDEGPGTGAYPVPPSPPPPPVPAPPTPAAAALGRVDASLRAYVGAMRGGSFGFAVSGSKTANGGPLLMSGPQLGYSYPTQLWELEVHGGGYDARGVSVPSLPTVGIGYGERTAWALTTGYSRTIDSFVETTRRTDGGGLQYLHGGVWKDAECRTETVRYRTEAEGVPVGPPVFEADVEACRTVHGPVVAATADGSLARSVQLAMWKRDLETVTALLAFDRVDTFDEFAAAVATMTWNENVLYAGADGHIAYWHPGLHPDRAPDADPRFPSPGTGAYDWRGLLPRSALPHAVDPPQGYLMNWNSQPAAGWEDLLGDPYSGRPSGASGRSNVLDRLLREASGLDVPKTQELAIRMGRQDQRWAEYRPVLASLAAAAGDSAARRAALDLVLAWDGTAFGPGAGTSDGAPEDETVTDGPAPTFFRELADRLRDEVLGDLPAAVVTRADAIRVESDALATTSHVFDATPADNLVLRVLAERTDMPLHHDWLAGRTPAAVLRAALDATVAAMEERHGADPGSWRAPHPRRAVEALTGVIGPSVTMPYEDRGSWEHIVAFASLGRRSPPLERPTPRPPPVAATGLPGWLPVAAAAAGLPAAWLRRRARAGPSA